MKKFNHFKVNKLIRDKLPETMRSQGVTHFGYAMDKAEHIQRLKEKLLEEADEVLAAATNDEILEELGDLYEVMGALVTALGFTQEQVNEKIETKKELKGGFDRGIFSGLVEVPHHHRLYEYCSTRPEKYPLVGGEQHLVARAVIIDQGHIILCKTVVGQEKDFWYLPGGHIEPEENIHNALIRELQEEIGEVFTIKRFLGCLEYAHQHHACHSSCYSVTFEAACPKISLDQPLVQQEATTQLAWVPLDQLKDIDCRPAQLRELIPGWMAKKSLF